MQYFLSHIFDNPLRILNRYLLKSSWGSMCMLIRRWLQLKKNSGLPTQAQWWHRNWFIWGFLSEGLIGRCRKLKRFCIKSSSFKLGLFRSRSSSNFFLKNVVRIKRVVAFERRFSDSEERVFSELVNVQQFLEFH